MGSNPHKVSPNDGNGCMVHAGILKPHGGDVSKAELTSGYPEGAKERFIKEIVDRLTFKIPVPFPCGIEIEPLPADQSSILQDLADEQKYPDFHANVLGHYRELARSLDAQSEFNILPICDPIAFGFKLGVNIEIPSLPDFMQFALPNLPALAAKLEMPPIELGLKIPGLLAPPIPSLPSFNFNLPLPPDAFLDLYDFRGIPPEIKFGKFILDLIPKIPDFMISLITLDIGGFLGEICKLARENLFAKQQSDENGVPQDVVRIVATEVLARKTIEMLIMHAMAKTIGTSPSGLVGQFSMYQGYKTPTGEKPAEEDKEKKVRDLIVEAAEYAAGLCWSNDSETNLSDRPYTDFIFQKEASSESYWTRQSAYKAAEVASACGIVARTCLARAGAVFVFDSQQKFVQSVVYGKNSPTVINRPKGGKVTYDYFNDEYVGGAVSALVAIAIKKKAFINPPGAKKPQVSDEGIFWQEKLYELPDMKRGDIIIIGNPGRNDDHVMVITKDYKKGDDELIGVHGGQLDQNNKGTATYIKGGKTIVIKKYDPAQIKAAQEAEAAAVASGIQEGGGGFSQGLKSTEDASSQANYDAAQKAKAEAEAAGAKEEQQKLQAEQNSSSQTQNSSEGGPPPGSSSVQKSFDPSQPDSSFEPKIGMRCAGIQEFRLYTKEGVEKRGIQNRFTPGGNLMPGPGYGYINFLDKGVAGNKAVCFGNRPVKVIINSAIMVLGKKEGDIDTTMVGKDFTNSTERIPVNLFKEMGVDSNDENEYPIEEFIKTADAKAAGLADAKKEKKKEKADKAKKDSADKEKKRQATLDAQEQKKKQG